jgi:sialate O-acetylesterase
MRKAVLVLSLLSVASPLQAEVRLPNLFSDHAVLQRDKPVRVWGWARPAELVTVTFHKQNRSATANQYGQWETWLEPELAGGPYTLTVSGDATTSPITRSDLLVGDVWIASGQSNMEMPLKGFSPDTQIKDHEKEIASADRPRIRLLVQRKRPSDVAMADTDDTWSVCTPETAKNFSAVAYFFGRAIQDHEKVPVGLIDTTWGGTPAMAWMSAGGASFAGQPSVYTNGSEILADQGRANEIKANLAAQDAADKAAGRTPAVHARLNDRGNAWNPAALYNGMIAPYVKYAIRGAIWYQGEADQSADYAPYYGRVFSAMIQDWRRQWAQGDFPFLFVQLASFGTNTQDGWSTVRDAQRKTLSLVNTGMAVTLDVGNAKNIHPADKQTVGARLAAAAMNISYGVKAEGLSPIFTEATTESSGMRAWLTHAEGLAPRTGTVGGFEIAGPDGKFVSADARVDKVGDRVTVVASSSAVTEPKYIRYGWDGVVTTYLYNSAGFPLGTFTSVP